MDDDALSPPLLSLSAVSLDTETTGLDARTARLVEIGAVAVAGARIDTEAAFETLVDPGEPVPAAAAAIHGIADADLRGAPAPAEALGRLADFVAGRVVIGHSTGYDLAVLEREAGRAGADWRRPRSLDVRLLARIAMPGLADHGLDALASHLGIGIEQRHSAVGDAVAAARIFAALIPRLRELGIRTLAEAETASQRLSAGEAMLRGTPLAAAPAAARDDASRALQRGDAFPYRHRVSDVMSAPPVELGPEATLGEAVRLMLERGISSVFVAEAGAALGIVTERDVLRALGARGVRALEAPLAEFRSTPLQTIPAAAHVYRAIGRMHRLGVRHLGVAGDDGRLAGAVTARNLLGHRAGAALLLGDRIAAGSNEAELADAWAKLPAMARRLVQAEIDPRIVAAVVSSELRMLAARAAELAEARLLERGLGAPPAAYALLVLGSAGRDESLLAADQDNAIVYADGVGSEGDGWFAALGAEVADILDAAGVPYCKGGVMAREAAWRMGEAAWRGQVDAWIGRWNALDLLNVDIFFDAATAHGDRALGEAIRAYAYRHAHGQSAFLRALSDTLTAWRSPLGVFGGFHVGGDGRVDLKLHGLLPLFGAARILSIRAGCPARATPDRLRAAAAAGLASSGQVEDLVEAHRIILGAVLAQQVADIEAGVRPGSRVDPRRLSRSRLAALRGAIRGIPGVIELAREGML